MVAHAESNVAQGEHVVDRERAGLVPAERRVVHAGPVGATQVDDGPARGLPRQARMGAGDGRVGERQVGAVAATEERVTVDGEVVPILSPLWPGSRTTSRSGPGRGARGVDVAGPGAGDGDGDGADAGTAGAGARAGLARAARGWPGATPRTRTCTARRPARSAARRSPGRGGPCAWRAQPAAGAEPRRNSS